MGDIQGDAKRVARRLGDSDAVEWGARLGYVASGILHFLLAWLVLQLAWGSRRGGRTADQSGAFGTLQASAGGKVLLFVMVAGLILLGLWQLTEAVRLSDLPKRLKALAKGITYGVIAATAITFLVNSGSSSGAQTESTTKQAMSWPGGIWLVGAAGLVVIGVGAYHVYKGVAQRFRQDLVKDPGQVAEWAARIGYVLKGVAFGTIGVLLVTAAARKDAHDSRGLDGAVKTLLGLPVGVVLVTLVALGFAAYGVYSLFRARLARV